MKKKKRVYYVTKEGSLFTPDEMRCAFRFLLKKDPYAYEGSYLRWLYKELRQDRFAYVGCLTPYEMIVKYHRKMLGALEIKARVGCPFKEAYERADAIEKFFGGQKG